MTFPRGALLFSALVFAVFGAWALVSPRSQLALVEVGAPTASACARTSGQTALKLLGTLSPSRFRTAKDQDYQA